MFMYYNMMVNVEILMLHNYSTILLPIFIILYISSLLFATHFLIHSDENKVVQPLWKTEWHFLVKLNTFSSSNLKNPFIRKEYI